jgi:lysophospholipase L1-like esterase
MIKNLLSLLILTSAAIGLHAQPITNQRLFDTIPFLPDHYAKRVARFESERITPQSIVFLGNSITEVGKWKKLTGDSAAVNRGIAGDITFSMLKRLDEIVNAKPAKLFLLIGINDIGKDIPGPVIADNIRKILDRFKRESPNTKLYVQTIFPVNPSVQNFPQHYDKNEYVKRANEHIRTVASKLGVALIDTFALFTDERGLLKQQYTMDGLHINADGYRLWVSHLKKTGAL